MQCSRIPPWSCCSCHTCGTFVVNSAWKMAPTLNCSINGFEIFWWCWTSFPTWQFSSLIDLLYVHRKLKLTLATCSWHGARVWFSFLWTYARSIKLETRQNFCLYSASKISVSGSAYSQNFWSWNWLKKTWYGNANCSAP